MDNEKFLYDPWAYGMMKDQVEFRSRAWDAKAHQFGWPFWGDGIFPSPAVIVVRWSRMQNFRTGQ